MGELVMEETTSQIAEIRAAASVLLERVQFMRQAGITFDGDRDLYEIFGYPRLISTRQYRERYQRGGIAARVVEALPKATWRGSMEVIEDENPNVSTAFEEAWFGLEKRLKIKAVLQRVDILAGLSSFAVLLIGAPGDLSSELPRGKPDSLLYLSPFAGGGGPGIKGTLDSDASIQSYVTDTSSIRFGLPEMYQLKRTDIHSASLQRPVHHSRVIHIAEGCLDDEVFGQPALERVWNLFDDLDKVTGGGAEAFWLRANQGFHINLDKDTKDLTSDQLTALRTNLEEYKHGMDRWIRTRGAQIETLGSDVANFSNPADALLTQIAGAKGIPKRILTGSEMGELASSQDRDNWKDQVNGRQTGYAEPYIIRPLVDRLIKYGYLPSPKKGPDEYIVKWPHIQVLTEQEKAEGAAQWASTTTVQGPVFTPEEIREKWYQLEPLTPKQVEELKPAPVEAPPPPAAADLLAAEGLDPDLLAVLEAALRTNNTQVIDAIIGIKHPAVLVDAEHNFATVQVTLPTDVGNQILAIGQTIPADDLAEDGLETRPHVTVKYGLHASDPKLLIELLKGTKPFTLQLGATGMFQRETFDVLTVAVTSDELTRLNALITENLAVTTTFPVYMPHATVAYLKPGRGARYTGVVFDQEVVVNALEFNSATDEMTVIPLVG